MDKVHTKFRYGTTIFGDIIPDEAAKKITSLPEATNTNIEIIKLLSLLNGFKDNFPEGFILNEFILIDSYTGVR
jgi:hypothetical protein